MPQGSQSRKDRPRVRHRGMGRMSYELSAGETYQWFPAHKPESERQTAWKVRWDYTHAVDPQTPWSNILTIKEALFQRAPNEDFIRIVSDLRVAELFTAYNDGTRLYDVTSLGSYDLLPATERDFRPGGVVPAKLLDAYLVREVVSDDIRWKRRGGIHHGQTLKLWAGLDAANYCFILEYGFRDDGAIVCRVGAGGHNLSVISVGREPHLHIPCWRIEPDLGAASANSVKVVRLVQSVAKGSARVDMVDFNAGREGGVVVDSRDFVSLRIENNQTFNRHQPDAKNVAYDLMSLAPLGGKTNGPGEEFTHADFWVTRADPETPGRNLPELRYNEVPRYAAHAEMLAGHPVVVWHHLPICHIPRDEDFGAFGDNVNNGVAMTTWVGFELRPRNLFAMTPHYP